MNRKHPPIARLTLALAMCQYQGGTGGSADGGASPAPVKRSPLTCDSSGRCVIDDSGLARPGLIKKH